MAWRRSIHTVRWGVLIVWAMFACGTPVSAVLVDKLVAVVNGEILTVQDFEDHLALRELYQTDTDDPDRQQTFQRLVDQVYCDKKPCGHASCRWMMPRSANIYRR